MRGVAVALLLLKRVDQSYNARRCMSVAPNSPFMRCLVYVVHCYVTPACRAEGEEAVACQKGDPWGSYDDETKLSQWPNMRSTRQLLSRIDTNRQIQQCRISNYKNWCGRALKRRILCEEGALLESLHWPCQPEPHAKYVPPNKRARSRVARCGCFEGTGGITDKRLAHGVGAVADLQQAREKCSVADVMGWGPVNREILLGAIKPAGFLALAPCVSSVRLARLIRDRSRKMSRRDLSNCEHACPHALQEGHQCTMWENQFKYDKTSPLFSNFCIAMLGDMFVH